MENQPQTMMPASIVQKENSISQQKASNCNNNIQKTAEQVISETDSSSVVVVVESHETMNPMTVTVSPVMTKNFVAGSPKKLNSSFISETQSHSKSQLVQAVPDAVLPLSPMSEHHPLSSRSHDNSPKSKTETAIDQSASALVGSIVQSVVAEVINSSSSKTETEVHTSSQMIVKNTLSTPVKNKSPTPNLAKTTAIANTSHSIISTNMSSSLENTVAEPINLNNTSSAKTEASQIENTKARSSTAIAVINSTSSISVPSQSTSNSKSLPENPTILSSTTRQPSLQPTSSTTTSTTGKQELSSQANIASPASKKPDAEQGQKMSNAEFKSCRSLFQAVQRHSSAWPFRIPVDPTAAGAPDYYNVISHPMDLSTVEKKLKAHEYAHPREFLEDIILMFSNCFLYNPPTHIVHQSGRALESFFGTQMNKLLPMFLLTNNANGGAMMLSSADESLIQPHGDASSETTNFTTSEKRPKRSIKAPKIFEPEEVVPKRARTSTSTSRRVSGMATSPVDLPFSSFPPPPPHTFSTNPSVATRRKSAGGNKRKSISQPAPPPEEVESSSSSDDEEDFQINALASCLQTVSQQLALLQNMKSSSSSMPQIQPIQLPDFSQPPAKKHKKSNSSVPTTVAAPKPPKAEKKPRKPRKSKNEFGPELKMELTNMISMFSSDNKFMAKVIQIITSGMPHLKGLEEELELDLNVVPPNVLWKLYNYSSKTMKAAGLSLPAQPSTADDSDSD